ncbi:hypothetical protein ACQKKX_14205 [Neorhizobium sp. NPDC001467]|uniref:hypothetical protein n=1 Tax=Neorhizobium sp. NPDC001467 TaxID=3390595 RepID=UPI003D07E0C2
MPDLSKNTSVYSSDADGTKTEDERQLTELLWQNRVSLQTSAGETEALASNPSFLASLKTALVLCVALPLSLLAYFSNRTAEDDFYA